MFLVRSCNLCKAWAKLKLCKRVAAEKRKMQCDAKTIACNEALRGIYCLRCQEECAARKCRFNYKTHMKRKTCSVCLFGGQLADDCIEPPGLAELGGYFSFVKHLENTFV